jgi:hypothetical protein
MQIGAKQLHEPVCGNCGSKLSDVGNECLTCGAPIGPPNVRAAERDEEKSALEARYRRIFEDPSTPTLRDRLTDFSEKMTATCAVFNVDIDFLYTFVTNEKTLYTTYRHAVRGQLRKPAKGEDDRRRMLVEGMIFGTYGEDIRYAALSLDGRGVKSYGDYSVRLREVTVSGRSTLLEDNSYVFVEKHPMQSGEGIPPGYRSTWRDREKLALAKLAQRILPTTTEADYPRLLLFSEGDYKTDDFIEVHIYGSFDAQAIESVTGNSPTGDDLKTAMVEVVKEHLKNAGKTWIEQ